MKPICIWIRLGLINPFRSICDLVPLQAPCDKRWHACSFSSVCICFLLHIQMAALEEHHARALDTQFASFQEEKQRFLLEVQASAPEAALVQAYEEDDKDRKSVV